MARATTPWTFFNFSELHISVAKTFSLRHNEIDIFCEQLGEAVRAAKLGEIFVSFDKWKLLVNDTKTTSFVSLVSSKNNSQVLDAIEAVDNIMRRFDHPTYYNPPIIHASIAWSPCDMMSILGVQEKALSEGIITPEVTCEAGISTLECKVGKVVYSWSLVD